MDDELRTLEIEKCKLEIAHLKRPFFLDIKFILPFGLSAFLAWFAYDEREQKVFSQVQLSKAESDATTLAKDLDTVIDKQRALVTAQTTAPDDKVKIATLSREFNLAVQGISQTRSKTERVKTLERSGFLALLDRDINGAITAFDNAHKIWPDYHNVAELKRLLLSKQRRLADRKSTEWKKLYQVIVEKYSWGMDRDLLTKMKLASVKSLRLFKPLDIRGG